MVMAIAISQKQINLDFFSFDLYYLFMCKNTVYRSRLGRWDRLALLFIYFFLAEILPCFCTFKFGLFWSVFIKCLFWFLYFQLLFIFILILLKCLFGTHTFEKWSSRSHF